jgi:hypothetical protein
MLRTLSELKLFLEYDTSIMRREQAYDIRIVQSINIFSRKSAFTAQPELIFRRADFQVN